MDIEDDRPKNILEIYKMDARPCGQCLIINNVDFEPVNLKKRRGSDIDCGNLERRFKSFNFIVLVKTNLKVNQILQELSALSEKDHSQFDCCVVIMLSHGAQFSNIRFPGAIHGVDGYSVSVQDITDFLNGEKCPTLQGKPKLFFIQACGGEHKDKGFEVSPMEKCINMEGTDDESDATTLSSSSDPLNPQMDTNATLPIYSDILVAYSTFPGYVSWRDSESGSWFVESLDKILEEYAAEVDLVTMLTFVNDDVAKKSAKQGNVSYKQMPTTFGCLRKPLYFQVGQLPIHS